MAAESRPHSPKPTMGHQDWLEDKLHKWLVAYDAGQDLRVEELCATETHVDTELLDKLQHAVSCLRRAERLLEGPGADAPAASPRGTPTNPDRIGRYRIDGPLGEGGFGRVYLGYDEMLQRRVAIKVPHGRHLADRSIVDSYLVEAQTVAGLDHPHIVPVFDVGSTDDFPYYQVSKLIEGTTLARRIASGRVPIGDSVPIVATVAEALHYAHLKGVVHRDVKPGNILIDSSGRPFLTDFGLALRERRSGDGAGYLGTPSYMSPEQARGEGHRVDGRSDIFSLGIVLYELLAGRRPFISDSKADLLEQIGNVDPWPPREIDDSIPRELERICLKALSKRAVERYSTAHDLAEELRAWRSSSAAVPVANPAVVAPVAVEVMRPDSRPVIAAPEIAPAPGSERTPIRVVPNGLRSFDARDSDFFLELLPGPRDRDGLPDSLRMWKSRIEDRDSERTFDVGLMYGPSGCGKSSLVKAGLIPRLARHVQTAYVEAVVGGTERRIARSLHALCPGLPADAPLPELFAAIRRGERAAAGRKVCVVIDQFEQWLHDWRADTRSDALLQALRQCDGARLQCLLMVRDDFWMAATRFMRMLEIPLVEGQNCNAVDLFPVRHAERVLTAFGRAYGELPEAPAPLSADQQQFVQQAVSSLADQGKVICVRLSLFAEMAKSRPWTPASLRQLGGAEGVGAAFLHETFSSSTSPPHHRYHERAARAVLKALLPDLGTDIKIARRSYSELLACTDYARRPTDFEQLIQLLDSELRLITPADAPDVNEADDNRAVPEKQYQLTHDYLVPSLRQWLVGKQRETRRGRAELRLAELTAHWSTRPERRRLPNAWEFLDIVLFTRRRDRTATQQQMVRAASRHHGIRFAIAGVLLICAVLIGREWRGRTKARELVEKLKLAKLNNVHGVVSEMPAYHRWTDPLIYAGIREAEANNNEHRQLNLRMAMLPRDSSQLGWLIEYVKHASVDEVSAIRELVFIRPDREIIVQSMEEHLQRLQDADSPSSSSRDYTHRLPAAAMIAGLKPVRLELPELGDAVMADLIAASTEDRGAWIDLLQTADTAMVQAAARAAADPARSSKERALAEDMSRSFQGKR